MNSLASAHDVDAEGPQWVRDVHRIVRDLCEPNPAIYYADLACTLIVGHAAFACFSSAQAPAVRTVAFLAAGFAFARAVTFTHEIAHYGARRLRRFKRWWNVLVGVPFLVPSFLYDEHRRHHLKHSYGTTDDSEYLPLAGGSLVDLVRYFGQAPLVPLLGVVRFVLLAPVEWCVPALSRRLWASSTAIVAVNWRFRRVWDYDSAEFRAARRLALACFCYGAGVFTLSACGVLPWTVLGHYYLVFLFVSSVNYVRILTSHRYRSDGRESSYLGQLLDSYTIPGHPILTELWAPLGTRYHALHHLVPSLPYHNLGRAHRRLMARLPADSPYRQTVRPSLVATLREVVGCVRRNAASRSMGVV